MDLVSEAHTGILAKMGALPIVVPVADGTLGCLEGYVEQMAGLLLVEGEAVEPARYRAPLRHRSWAGETHAFRDEIELRLARRALARRLPLLGISRGAHVLNVVAGGTLYTDLKRERKSGIRHRVEGSQRDRYRHSVRMLAGTPLKSWYGNRDTLRVDSDHAQGIKTLARRFRPMAFAEDGLLEAFYDPAERFVLGLQFRPERMLRANAGHAKVYRAFVDAARRASRRRAGAD